MKIALGTVQFGMPYGVANSQGKVDLFEAKEILEFAKNVAIDTIDTAIAYGSSEKCLGDIGVNHFNVITKLPEVPSDYGSLEKWIHNNVENSISKLGVRSLSGLLLHRPEQLLESDKKDYWLILNDLKDSGIVEKIGFSIYSPDELDKLWDLYKPDIVQSPFNVIDQRLKNSGWLEKMYKENVEVHARSIFLQGLLLMKNRPEKFNEWNTVWNQWDDWLKDNNISPVEASLSFVLSEKRISKIVVGVDNLGQLSEIINVLKNNTRKYPNELSIDDIKLLNPSKWSAL
jgi:aryl-alcohol dehydrogenase-like predicted oxidoreductase